MRPAWPGGCCRCWARGSHGARKTTFVLASRAPYDKIAAVAEERDWFVPWYSTYSGDFNYDYQVTLDTARGQTEYN